MQSNDTNTRTSAHNENTLPRSAQEQQLLAQFQKLNKPTQQILLVMMRAAIDKDVILMRSCQVQLPEDQRHLFDDCIANIEQSLEVQL